MGMKGHAIFELTNTKTGEKRVYKDDNMVTNFLEQFCIPTGPLNYNLYAMLASYASQKSSTSSSYATLDIEQPHCFTKGLLLFEDEVDEDADNIWPRAGNKMVGQASVSSYSGANTRAGSFNYNESGEVENGYRYVWDFSTSQANGQISCACLTTPWGAVLGAGNSQLYSDFYSSCKPFMSRYSQYSPSNQVRLVTEGVPLLLDYDKKCSYQLKGICTQRASSPYSASVLAAHSCFIKKEIRIRREMIPFDEYNIFSKPLSSMRAKEYEDLVFPMPQAIIDSCNYDMIFTPDNMSKRNFNLCTSLNAWGKHIYIYFGLMAISTSNKESERCIYPDNDLIIIDIDTENDACTTFRVTNTTGSTLKMYSYYDTWSQASSCSEIPYDVGYYTTAPSSYPSPIFITDKYVIMHMDDGKVYRISRADNTDVKAFTLEGNENTYLNLGEQYNQIQKRLHFIPLGKNVEQFNKNKVIGSIYKDSKVFLFDFDEATYSLVNANTSDNVLCNPEITKILGTDLFVFCESHYNLPVIYGATYPTMLTTINNLEAPITKTSADTMKVTYIITQADSQGEQNGEGT